jgi:hypothetical protein
VSLWHPSNPTKLDTPTREAEINSPMLLQSDWGLVPTGGLITSTSTTSRQIQFAGAKIKMVVLWLCVKAD